MFITDGEIWTSNKLNRKARYLIHKKFTDVIRGKYSISSKNSFGGCGRYNIGSGVKKPDDFDIFSKNNKDAMSYRRGISFAIKKVAFEGSTGGYNKRREISTLDLLREIKKEDLF